MFKPLTEAEIKTQAAATADTGSVESRERWIDTRKGRLTASNFARALQVLGNRYTNYFQNFRESDQQPAQPGKYSGDPLQPPALASRLGGLCEQATSDGEDDGVVALQELQHGRNTRRTDLREHLREGSGRRGGSRVHTQTPSEDHQRGYQASISPLPR